ncbi:alkaline phosphatase [Desulfoscipio gibsoniae]|uniref:Alkaline phosphatase n=1 Tax=Desulfoscipio gibsoniae DSM 7213 TaxID=767817 RepID=R4KLJ3_9FIRM|nr:alkaline phosphatase [Desulfoscipio gibsoniae]AGL03519.1 Alkaline phosphatase [Desulfoscipio gibsoniae DSM 7213]
MKFYNLKKKATSLILSGSLLLTAAMPNAALAKDLVAQDKPLAKNIIVMISDGCGYNQLDTASMYQYGKTGGQVYEHFPVKYGMSTYSEGSYDPNLAWGSFDYVKSGATDSAAAATAMSTGVKTYDAAIGVGIDGTSLKHVAERAEELGKATGVVTSVQLSHATPAGFVAHNASRNDYSGIANEMIKDSATDVIMGAGNPWFDNNGQQITAPNTFKYVGGEATWQGLVDGTLEVADANGDGIADPWTLIQTKDEFIDLIDDKTPERVIGVPQVFTTLQQGRSGDDKAEPYAVPMNQNAPTLAEMTKGALNVLDNDSDGFFLMIEGGAIDWAGHANQSGRVIEEEIDFNKSVEAVVDWVKENSNWGETLLIVTGDHETGYLTGPGSDPTWEPLVNNNAGNLPGMQWNSGSHTNSLIPFFAKGDAARLFKSYADETDPVRGKYIDNIEIAKVIFEIMK